MGKGIFEVLFEYWPIFLRGLAGTLEYSFIAVTLGSILGAVVAVIHLSKNKFVSFIASVYVNVLRGTPLLVQMYISYYFLPMAFPVLNKIDKIYFVMFALILNSSAYVAEIIRSGINAVDSGQTEAARSLGMTKGQTMLRIVLPQAIKNILPALGNELITLFKDTSLVTVIGLTDLTKAAQQIQAKTYQAFMPYIGIAIMYLVVVMILTKLLGILERRLRESDRR